MQSLRRWADVLGWTNLKNMNYNRSNELTAEDTYYEEKQLYWN
jgi:hypothetical protein